jgi:hypothetical protein
MFLIPWYSLGVGMIMRFGGPWLNDWIAGRMVSLSRIVIRLFICALFWPVAIVYGRRRASAERVAAKLMGDDRGRYPD